MKQKDIAIIVAAGFMSAVFAFIISNYLLAPDSSLQSTVKKVPVINSDFPEVSNLRNEPYFSNNPINPTPLIEIRENNNESPFDKSEQSSEDQPGL